jgi:hypothetical protein
MKIRVAVKKNQTQRASRKKGKNLDKPSLNHVWREAEGKGAGRWGARGGKPLSNCKYGFLRK